MNSAVIPDGASAPFRNPEACSEQAYGRQCLRRGNYRLPLRFDMGRRSISPETALRLGRYFGTGAELWSRLQADFDLS